MTVLSVQVPSLGGTGGVQSGTGGIAGAGGTAGAGGAGGTLPKSFPCNNPTPVSGGYIGCDGDWRHRPTKEACPPRLPRPDPTCMFGYAGSCATDSECTARPDGFCPGGINMPCECQYPCRRDEECQAGEICECSSGICMPATCATDADCNGAFCAQYWLTNACTWGFACQTALDECASQGDCGQQQQCSLVNGHRASTPFCPPPPP